ncbi:hypothetical protein Pyn_04805 [Prunus yedoensis var. nudiflora]|uniref:Uncharacterized protein n=1 Tax=Prunus yedoensis var. nudiflora TaxID=2094558 RepID=A0A314UHF4_PRUYE|nr:hypothetical protein Pyn_04805 [Prunus yedoensis var. nudiflora]
MCNRTTISPSNALQHRQTITVVWSSNSMAHTPQDGFHHCSTRPTPVLLLSSSFSLSFQERSCCHARLMALRTISLDLRLHHWNQRIQLYQFLPRMQLDAKLSSLPRLQADVAYYAQLTHMPTVGNQEGLLSLSFTLLETHPCA